MNRGLSARGVSPLLGTIVRLEPGRLLVARRTFTPDVDFFLTEHTLGRHIARTDPDLRGLPIMPMTVSMAMLAEAGALLQPAQVLVEMRDVRASRWIAFEERGVTLLVQAEVEDGSSVRAWITEEGAGDAPIVEATLHYAEQRPPAPPAEEERGHGLQPARRPAESIYHAVMFHGPLFRGVLALDGVDSKSASATLRTQTPTGFFAHGDRPSFEVDPVLLDQPGQVVGLWTEETLDERYVIFPYALNALHLYDAPMGDSARCLARIELVGEQQVVSDLDVVTQSSASRGEEGLATVAMRLEGWADRRFELPEPFFRFLNNPGSQVLTSSRSTAPLPGDCLVHEIDLDTWGRDFFSRHGAIWQKVLAHLILGRRERTIWYGLRTPLRRRVEWLLGRLAAKDALRQMLRLHSDLDLLPADFEILPDAEGYPVVTGPWLDQLAAAPLVSIAHSGGRVIAAAAPGDRYAGIGIDVEALGRVTDGAAELAFSTGEEALLGRADRADAATRIWCAKEAFAKTTGRGFNAGPLAFEVTAVEGQDGKPSTTRSAEGAQRLWVRKVHVSTQSATARLSTLPVNLERRGNWIEAFCCEQLV